MSETAAATPGTPAIIRPTVGRIVWYWREPVHAEDAQPEAAKIVYVHNDSLVNLRVYDHNGGAAGVTSVPLKHPHEGVPGVSYCEWMPYQQGQAAKTEALEAAARASNNAALGGAAVASTGTSGKGETGARK